MYFLTYVATYIHDFNFSDYAILSEFTIALFEDTGWYKANYSALYALNQQKLHWGKGRVCSYVCTYVNSRILSYMHTVCIILYSLTMPFEKGCHIDTVYTYTMHINFVSFLI